MTMEMTGGRDSCLDRGCSVIANGVGETELATEQPLSEHVLWQVLISVSLDCCFSSMGCAFVVEVENKEAVIAIPMDELTGGVELGKGPFGVFKVICYESYLDQFPTQRARRNADHCEVS